MRSLSVLTTIVVLGLAGCSGCGGKTAESEAARIRDKFADQDITYGGLPEPTEEEKSIIREGVQSIATTTNTGDWAGHAELILPIMFKNDSAKQAMIETASKYNESGWITTYKKFEVEDFSPFVPYAQGRAALMNVNSLFEVSFSDAWTGNPANFLPSLRDRHPDQQVLWHNEDSTYTIAGRQVVLVFNEEETDKWYYLQEAAMSKDDVIQLFKPEDLQILSSYER